jgi:hypothetical protein
MPQQLDWWEAFKYGPTVLAGFVALWTAGLITIELNRKTIRPQAKNLLMTFMGFSLVLTVLSYGLTLLETNPHIATAIGDLEGHLAGKDSVIHGIPLSASQLSELDGHVKLMCKDIVDIAHTVNIDPANDCQVFLSTHQ